MTALRKVQADYEGIGLESLLAVAVRTRVGQVLLRPPARRELWAGDAGAPLDAAAVTLRAARLGALLHLSRLPEGSAALIMAAPGDEQLVAILSALRAGLTPTLLPLDITAAALQQVFDGGGPLVAIGMTRCGDVEPARLLRDAAARSMNARLVCAFGPDHPDGSVPLGFILQNGAALERPAAQGPARSIVSVNAAGAPERLAELDLVGAAVEIARVLKPRPDCRIVSLMMGADLPTLAAGPYLSMLTGAEFMPLGVFALSALWASLSDGKPVLLVAPAAIEPALQTAGVLEHQSLAGVALIHRAPRVGAPPPSRAASLPVVDVETAAPGMLSVTARR
jgi:hypothetical protein